MSNFKIIHGNERKVSLWSGGTTTELLILPEEAEFKSGEFDLRISIATVETEESTFTPLPNVNRTLLLLEGELSLSHKNHHSITLMPFEQDTFKGEWETTSYGKVTDFNIMTKNDTKATVEVIQRERSDFNLPISEADSFFLYVWKGSIKNEEFELFQGDSILIFGNLTRTSKIQIEPEAILIKVSIHSVH